MNPTLLIKRDKVVKQKAKKLAKEMGVPLINFVNNYFKSFIVDRQVTFYAPVPNKKTAAAIIASRKEVKAGKTAGPFDSVDEMMKSLNS
ncbi:MAG: hypothetical protein WCI76_01870 [bacterium]